MVTRTKLKWSQAKLTEAKQSPAFCWMMGTKPSLANIHMGIHHKELKSNKRTETKYSPSFCWMKATNSASPISHLHLGYLGMVTLKGHIYINESKHRTQSFTTSNDWKYHNNFENYWNESCSPMGQPPKLYTSLGRSPKLYTISCPNLECGWAEQ